MDEFFNALLGPAATVAAGMYLRAAIIKRSAGEDWVRAGAMVIASLIMTWLAFWRLMAALGAMDLTEVRTFTTPMGIAVYGLHFYLASRVTQTARESGAVRREIKKLQHESRAWGGQGTWDGVERRKAPR